MFEAVEENPCYPCEPTFRCLPNLLLKAEEFAAVVAFLSLLILAVPGIYPRLKSVGLPFVVCALMSLPVEVASL